MEHLAPVPDAALRAAAQKALDETPLREAYRLLATFEWTIEDLAYSEASQSALVAGGWPLALVDKLFRRHQQEAARLLAPELTGWPQPAERTHPGVSLIDALLQWERSGARDLKRAGGER